MIREVTHLMENGEDVLESIIIFNGSTGGVTVLANLSMFYFDVYRSKGFISLLYHFHGSYWCFQLMKRTKFKTLKFLCVK